MVRRASDATIAAMRDGVPATVPHEAAKAVFVEAGLDHYRQHTSGYGMAAGFPPSWGEPVNMFGGNTYTLRTGMVVSVEPNLFIHEERIGVRLIDNVLITAEGRGAAVAASAGPGRDRMTHQPSDDRSPPPRAYTAGVTPAKTAGPLQTDRRTDVAVIGAGFTGLSTALHLAEAGASVTVLEGRSVGWGASGRAFGQVVPYLKHDERSIVEHYGKERRGSDSRCGRSRAGPGIRLDRTAPHRLQRRAHGIDFRGTCGWRVRRAGATCQVLAGDRGAGPHAGRFRVRGRDRIILLPRCPAR